jgi:hypothetical protein
VNKITCYLDYGGNVTAQIAYSNDSPRWKFPNEYHSHSFTAEDGATIDIIMIDTGPLAGRSNKLEGEEGYFDPLPEKPKADAADQWTWIENTIKASTADFVLVTGHYPVYSVCEHGPTASLVTNLRPLLIEANAQYMCGHDHCMEHLVEPGTSVNYYLTGMGIECCYRSTNIKNVPANSLKWYMAKDTADKSVTSGFSSVSVSHYSKKLIISSEASNKVPTLVS